MNTTTKKKQPKNQFTLLQAVETLAEKSSDSKLSSDFMKSVKNETKFLAKQYGITERQAVLFAVCMDAGPNNVDFRDIASHLDINRIAVLGLASDLDALVHRRMLRYRDVKECDSFNVSQAVIRCLKRNEVFQQPSMKGLDCPAMFERLAQWFEDLDDSAIGPIELSQELQELFDANPKLNFVKKVRQQELCPESELLLVKFCHYLINKNDEDIRFNQMDDVYEGEAAFSRAKGHLRKGTHALQKQKLIEFLCVDGIADNTRFKLTEDAKRDLLSEMNLNTTVKKNKNYCTITQQNGIYQITLFGLTQSESEKFIKNFIKTNHLAKVSQMPCAAVA